MKRKSAMLRYMRDNNYKIYDTPNIYILYIKGKGRSILHEPVSLFPNPSIGGAIACGRPQIKLGDLCIKRLGCWTKPIWAQGVLETQGVIGQTPQHPLEAWLAVGLKGQARRVIV